MIDPTPAERAILYLLTLGDATNEILAIVKSEWFITPSARTLLKKITDINLKYGKVDPVILHTQLDDFEFKMLMSDDQKASANNIYRYCKILAEENARRKIVALLPRLAQNPKLEILSEIRGYMQEIDSVSVSAVKVEDAVLDYLTRMSEIDKSPSIRSGFKRFDERIMGFKAGRLYTIGARPSTGKTSILCQMSLNMAEAKNKVLLISSEMDMDAILGGRIIPMISEITASKFQSQSRILKELPIIKEKHYSRFVGMELYISEKEYASLEQIRLLIETVKPEIVCIDYLQLLTGPMSESKRLEISALTKGLKRMAKEYKLPIVILAQLNRESEKHIGAPKLSDLSESASIEQDSDVVVLVWADPQKNNQNSPNYILSFFIAKNRFGETDFIDFVYSKDTTNVREASLNILPTTARNQEAVF